MLCYSKRMGMFDCGDNEAFWQTFFSFSNRDSWRRGVAMWRCPVHSSCRGKKLCLVRAILVDKSDATHWLCLSSSLLPIVTDILRSYIGIPAGRETLFAHGCVHSWCPKATRSHRVETETLPHLHHGILQESSVASFVYMQPSLAPILRQHGAHSSPLSFKSVDLIPPQYDIYVSRLVRIPPPSRHIPFLALICK